MAITNKGREVHRCLPVGNGFANTDSPIQHFGVGPMETIERIEITWPSGVIQTISNPPMNQVTDVTECGMAGDTCVGPCCAIPAVSEWGMVVMALLLLTAGTSVLHRGPGMPLHRA